MTPGKRNRSKRRGERKFWMQGEREREIVMLRMEHEEDNGGVPRDNGGVSARKRAGKEGKKG